MMTFDNARDETHEATPRTSEVCPECGNMHTYAVPSVVFFETIFYFCSDCHSNWYVRGRKDINR